MKKKKLSLTQKSFNLKNIHQLSSPQEIRLLKPSEILNMISRIFYGFAHKRTMDLIFLFIAQVKKFDMVEELIF